MSFHCRLLVLYLCRHPHKISCGLGYKEMEGKEKNVEFLHSFSVLKSPLQFFLLELEWFFWSSLSTMVLTSRFGAVLISGHLYLNLYSI